MTIVWSDVPGFVPPRIVIQYDEENETGVDWAELQKLDDHDPHWYVTPLGRLRDAVEFLLDAVKKMTGQTLEVESLPDLSRGIVFTRLGEATPDIKHDDKVRRALATHGTDPAEANEAYYVRTEQDRIILVANTYDGLVDAVVDLTESVGYQVLGMGPNWVDVPDRKSSLAFDAELSGRAGFYLRWMWPGGQATGTGTILTDPLNDPADETVAASYQRWRVGARLAGRSVPAFTGHRLPTYHKAVAKHIREDPSGDTSGFLAPTHVGPDEDRQKLPPAQHRGHLWINKDPASADVRIFGSDGTAWREDFGVFLDISVGWVREIVFDDARRLADAAFEAWPEDVAQMAIDPEDGGIPDAEFDQYRKNRDWFPEYRAAHGAPLGDEYKLHEQFGLDQPNELWDPTSRSDTMYGFALWMLNEYDKWIDGLPDEQQKTSAGVSKKSLIRVSFLSYTYHDVPPNFNVDDDRVRVNISGSSPKHRGQGKWAQIRVGVDGEIDMFRALGYWLPELGTYHVFSNAANNDWGLSGIQVAPDLSPKGITAFYAERYDAGIRARTMETDFNFGKFGLGYYLIARKLWNPALSEAELDAIRDDWLRRAYGSGWQTMKEYYDFMLVSNYPENTQSSWAHAVGLIAKADARIDPVAEPAAQSRIDDLKQFWYYYFLQFPAPPTEATPALRQFVWQGQMSYMTATHLLMGKLFRGKKTVGEAAGSDIAEGPAHFSAAQTDSWWVAIRKAWPERRGLTGTRQNW